MPCDAAAADAASSAASRLSTFHGCRQHRCCTTSAEKHYWEPRLSREVGAWAWLEAVSLGL